MHISTAANRLRDSAQAARAAIDDALSRLNATPELLLVHASSVHELDAVAATIAEMLPAVPTQGASSCRGVMSNAGFFSDGLGVLALSDPEGSYGVGAAAIGEDVERAGAAALLDALAQAGRPGEVPDLVWLTAAPGAEERVLEGIMSVVGRDVPILGGSSADDDARGRWRQLANGAVHDAFVVVGVFFAAGSLSWAVQSGYSPTDRAGVVTAARDRVVYTIDHRPAAEVYDEWTDGLIADELQRPGSIFRKTTLAPLGRQELSPNGVPHYLLAHPDKVLEDKSLTLFAAVPQNEPVCLMRGSSESLMARAARVARAAIEEGDMQSADTKGALVVYCAGCMLSLESDMERVAQSLHSALGGVPFLGTFTFGEQGPIAQAGNRHSNLMISVVTFGNRHA